jgi:hypothetical protein
MMRSALLSRRKANDLAFRMTNARSYSEGRAASPLPLAVLAALPTGGRAQPAAVLAFLSGEVGAASVRPPCGGDGRQARGGLFPRRPIRTLIFKQETPHVPRS